MMLSLVVHIRSLQWVVPAAIMMGSAPCFFSLWSAWRVISAILPRRVYIKGDDLLFSVYMRLVLFFFHTYARVKIQVYGDIDVLYSKKENAVYISNHQCTVDWVIAVMLASQQGSLGSIRFVLKDGLRFFPLYGFYFKQHSCIFVKRSGKFKPENAQRDIAKLKTNQLPTWLVIFPEGTRFKPDLQENKEKIDMFAIEQGVSKFDHVLIPRLKALQLSLQEIGDYVDAVYDVTIAYSNTQDVETGTRTSAPGMPEFLQKSSPEVHIHFKKFLVSDVPKEESKLKEWLFERFMQKDLLLSHFYSKNPDEHGKFPGNSQVLQIGKRSTLPALIFFGSCLAGVLATSEGRSLYWKVALFGTVGGCVWMSLTS
ncbi:hypothetical protein ACJMK2_041510 [Sinanodonta woodiana]|uniref:Phospholipid/glycerol acyltransferase domain-containing protein n=1 Tax=Sinanodonta woodiana TaxID=1069815 RepID=A0ABD3W524_SINWO